MRKKQQQQYSNKCSASEILKTNYTKSFIFTSYHHEINLDTIPLPTAPYPHDIKTTSTTTTTTLKPTCRSTSCDTIDSFEILEQTIMKQKRLARAKNVDLRKKILLKRTFDRVCEIMDHENGFEEEDNEEKLPQITIVVQEQPVSTLTSLASQSQVEPNKTTATTFASLETVLDSNSTQFSLNTSFSSGFVSQPSKTLTQLKSTSALKRKCVDYTSSSKKARIQRRPSNSDEDEEESDEEEEEEADEYQQNYICLFDDDNDPFGISDVVSLTSF